jgi:hypothetical protein
VVSRDVPTSSTSVAVMSILFQLVLTGRRYTLRDCISVHL